MGEKIEKREIWNIYSTKIKIKVSYSKNFVQRNFVFSCFLFYDVYLGIKRIRSQITQLKFCYINASFQHFFINLWFISVYFK